MSQLKVTSDCSVKERLELYEMMLVRKVIKKKEVVEERVVKVWGGEGRVKIWCIIKPRE